jgi:transcriptional regulator
MADAPSDYIDTMLKSIVGLEIAITGLVGKFKLSQNKEARDIRNAGEALGAQGQAGLSEAMIAVATIKEERG